MTDSTEKKYSKLAKVITLVTTPAVVGGVLLFYAVYMFSPTTEIFYKTFLSVLFLSVVLPVAFIFLLMKKGKIGNFHMKEREDRILPFGFTLMSGTFSILVVRYLNNDPVLVRMFLVFFLMALGYSVITFLKFKISGHTFVFTSAMIILIIFLDLRFIFLLPLVFLIGWARVYLEEHTLGEVVGGAAYAITSFILFSLLINN
ncbi:MAG: phosphatase PAP2 family protein [Patescibacteria group bacterium]